MNNSEQERTVRNSNEQEWTGKKEIVQEQQRSQKNNKELCEINCENNEELCE